MKNIVDFITDAAQKNKLIDDVKDMFKKGSSDELQKWFQSHGYEVSVDDCKKLIDNKDALTNAPKVGLY